MINRLFSSFVLALLLGGTTLGLAATDLVLPAVPSFPAIFQASIEEAQWVLVAYAIGSGAGLLIFGELGARYDQRRLLLLSFGLFAALSLAAAHSANLETLIALRLLQGLAGAAAAVYAPGFIRLLFDSHGAVKALGFLGSCESLIPALAPMLGLWLLRQFGWQTSFFALSGGGALLAVLLLATLRTLPKPARSEGEGGYLHLLRRPAFMRFALSHALALGGILTFVFGAPAMISFGMKGDLGDFIAMQVSGIAFFILSANLSGRLVKGFAARDLVFRGACLSAAGCVGLLLYGFVPHPDPRLLAPLWIPVNFGFGLRGPPGFMEAVKAAGGNGARGAALVILFVLLLTAMGTACAAPFIELGLAPLAAIAGLMFLGSVLCVRPG